MKLYANPAFSCEINNTLPKESFYSPFNMLWLLEAYASLILSSLLKLLYSTKIVIKYLFPYLPKWAP